MRFLAKTSWILPSLALAAACAAPATTPASSTPPARAALSAPPAASSAPPLSSAPEIVSQPVALPAINHAALPNGLTVWHVGSRSLPTIHVRLVVRSGADRPGLARLTALAVERARNPAPVPGAPKPAAPPLQADVPVSTPPGAAVFSLDLPRDLLEPAFDLIGAMIRQPRLETAPIALLRSADADRILASVRADPAGVARGFAAADLLGASPPGSEDLSRVLPADLKAFHKSWYTPRTTGIVVVGDVTFDEAMEAARRAFGSWEAPAPQSPPGPATAPAQYTRVVVLDRPQAADATIVVAAPGAPVADPSWPALWLARELMARGNPAAPCSTSASDLVSAQTASGPAPFVSCFHAPAQQLSATVTAALQRAQALSNTEPSDADLRAARNAWSDKLATGLASIPALADFMASALAAGMDHDAPSRFVSQTNAASSGDVKEAARSRMARGALVVVAADANRSADELSRFGDVTVLDPAASFARKRHIPANPMASAPTP